MLLQQHRIETRRLFAVAVVASLALAGCAGAKQVADLTAEIPRAATPAVIRAGVDTLDDPALRRRVLEIVASPEMRAVERELAAGMVAGMVDGTLATLGEKERAARIHELASSAMAGVVQSMSRELPEVTAGVVRGAVSGAVDPAVARRVASALTGELGPAVEQTLRQDVTPGVAGMVADEELQRAVGGMARLLGREVVLGATEALAAQKPPAEPGSLLSLTTGLARQGARLFGSAAWVLLLIIVALFVWILKLLAQARSLRGEAERREATAHLLEQQTRAANDHAHGRT